MNGTNPNSAAQKGATQGGGPDAAAPASTTGQQHNHAFLGVSVDKLAGLSVDELEGNKVAITMMLHFYKQLAEENTTLRNERNTLSTYVTGYQQKKSDARVGAVLSTMSTVFMGFGINLLTGEAPKWYGVSLFIPALIMLLGGLYFSLRQE